MKYTAKFFKDGLPEWKRKKDGVLAKMFYRPVSFFLSAICSNAGISANAISYFSAVIAVLAAICYIFGNYYIAILGGVLVNIWILLDCTDGNIARSVKTMPMGEFADALSSYLLVGLIFNTAGFYVYLNGGLFIEKNCGIIILIGALASSFDTLCRLIFQKYIIISKEYYQKKGIEFDSRSSESKLNKLRVRIDAEIGIGGILPLMILLGTIFNFLDVVIILWGAYYFALCFASVVFNVVKAKKIEKSEE